MANPTSRHSRARRDRRLANWKGAIPNMMKCPACGQPKMPHRVCLSCGKYDGKTVLEVVEKENA
jgi:large subunit ribosomal protein L32